MASASASSSAPSPAHRAHPHPIAVERVLKHLRLAKAKRTLQARLGLANFKASRGWHHMAFDEIEPFFFRPSPVPTHALRPANLFPRRHTSRLHSAPHPYQLASIHSTPSRKRPGPDPSLAFTQRTPPDEPASNHIPHRRTPIQSGSPPLTPHSMARSARSCPAGGEPPLDEADYTDQNVAAQLMLFLASGSPSPEHRLGPSPPQHELDPSQSPQHLS